MRRRADVLWRTAPGYLVVATVAGDVLEVDGPGWELWDLLATTGDVDEIALTLSRRYGVAAARVRRDLDPMIEALVRGGFADADG